MTIARLPLSHIEADLEVQQVSALPWFAQPNGTSEQLVPFGLRLSPACARILLKQKIVTCGIHLAVSGRPRFTVSLFVQGVSSDKTTEEPDRACLPEGEIIERVV